MEFLLKLNKRLSDYDIFNSTKDLCVIHLDDNKSSWQETEEKIHYAAIGDFITVFLSPLNHDRQWKLKRAIEILRNERGEDTAVACMKEDKVISIDRGITVLSAFTVEEAGDNTVIIIGSSRGMIANSSHTDKELGVRLQNNEGKNLGQNIMIESFRTIKGELHNPNIPLWKLWPMLHAIHTTADFEMENLIWMDERATERLYEKVISGEIKTIVTDVTMVASGIRKGALKRLGIEVISYINDNRSMEMSKEMGITRSQAGMRIAAKEHPHALYAFGNAPTALLELCRLIKDGECNPVGIIGAPVGFVNVEESKYETKAFTDIPKIIIDGRKGGSNLAATLVNSILTFDDAAQLRPGRDV